MPIDISIQLKKLINFLIVKTQKQGKFMNEQLNSIDFQCKAYKQAYELYLSELMQEHCICQKEAMDLMDVILKQQPVRFLKYYVEFKHLNVRKG